MSTILLVLSFIDPQVKIDRNFLGLVRLNKMAEEDSPDCVDKEQNKNVTVTVDNFLKCTTLFYYPPYDKNFYVNRKITGISPNNVFLDLIRKHQNNEPALVLYQTVTSMKFSQLLLQWMERSIITPMIIIYKFIHREILQSTGPLISANVSVYS